MEDSPYVGIINPEDICSRLIYYQSHKSEYDEDLFKITKIYYRQFFRKSSLELF